MAKTSKQFIQDLPKIYGTYTGGFLVFIVLMGIAEKMGVSGRNIGLAFVGFTIFIYALIGWISRTTDVDEYYLAGKKVPTVFNGMATAADWMSGASFVAMAGGIYFGGYTYMAFLIGWTGGYVLVSTLLAPYLRKFGCYTVPDFIGARYGGNLARFCAVLILLIASFTYVTAQITATGSIAQKALSTPAFPVSFEFGCWTGLITILLCSMLGGMRSVTWSQVAQYIVLIIAYLIPIFWISWKYNFGVFPHIMLGDEVQRLAALEQQYGLTKHTKDVMDAAKIPSDALGNATSLKYIVGGHSAVPAGHEVAWRYISLAICMMVGTASLPHILMRYFTTPTVTSARRSVGWSLFFIGLLYLSAPMLMPLLGVVPLQETLVYPNLDQVADETKARWIHQPAGLRRVRRVVIGAMSARRSAEYLRVPGTLVIVPGDREDLLEAFIAGAGTQPLSGVFFSNGLLPDEGIIRRLKEAGIAMAAVEAESFAVTARINNMTVKTMRQDADKIPIIRKMISESVDIPALLRAL
jgi:cation/acetate symporter